jgi:chemotaxis methyl-accepting protein methylase
LHGHGRHRVGANIHMEALALELDAAGQAFWQNEAYWERLRERLRPELADVRSRLVRAWVPCCGTGQEAYNVAMLLHELRGSRSGQVQVFGSDQRELAIGIARTGRYPLRALERLSRERRLAFFDEDEEGASVCRSLRNSLLFTEHDIQQGGAFSRIDLLSARSLLRDRALDPHLAQAIAFALRDGGIMIVRPSDASLIPRTLFEPLDPEAGLFRAVPALDAAPPTAKFPVSRMGSSEMELRALVNELSGLGAQRHEELDKLRQAHAELRDFVEVTGLLALVCDRELAVQRSSTALSLWLGIRAIAPGTRLEEFVEALPGGSMLVELAHEAQATGRAHQALHKQSGPQGRAILARVHPFSEAEGEVDGVVIVFTDVTPLEEARARAAEAARRQAAIATLGLTALEEQPSSAEAMRTLFGKALDALGSLGCEHAFVLEGGHEPQALMLRASLSPTMPKSPEPRMVPIKPGPLHRALAGTSVVQFSTTTSSEMLASLGLAKRVECGMAYPLRAGREVYGLLVACFEHRFEPASEDAHFMQAVANVLANAMMRQRVLNRLALERGVGLAMAEADDEIAMSRSVEAVLDRALGTRAFEVWLRGGGGSGDSKRVWPRGFAPIDRRPQRCRRGRGRDRRP